MPQILLLSLHKSTTVPSSWISLWPVEQLPNPLLRATTPRLVYTDEGTYCFNYDLPASRSHLNQADQVQRADSWNSPMPSSPEFPAQSIIWTQTENYASTVYVYKSTTNISETYHTRHVVHTYRDITRKSPILPINQQHPKRSA